MDIQKLKNRYGYSGKPQQWQFAFDLIMSELQSMRIVPEGFTLVEKPKLEHWYFDENESMWWDEADIFLCGLTAGEVKEVKHKEYLVTDTTPKYAARVWDEHSKSVGTWVFFTSKDEAENAAAYCAAKVEEQDYE